MSDRGSRAGRVRTRQALALLVVAAHAFRAPARAAVPEATPEGVRFTLVDRDAGTVFLAGAFNGWDPRATPLRAGADGLWEVTVPLAAGVHQYKFVIDGSRWIADPAHAARVDDNRGGFNSVFALTAEGGISLEGYVALPAAAPRRDPLAPHPGRFYLNLIWHQHQPLYADPATDTLRGPWVRTHATKDYYDMAALLAEFPAIHCSINLTSVLLYQLQHYYVERLAPFYDPAANRIDAARYFRERAGPTDPWIDLALTPTERLTAEQSALVCGAPWNARDGISEVMQARFPEYQALRGVACERLATEQLRAIKFWFFAAHFDPDFLHGPVTLATGAVVDLSDLVIAAGDGRYRAAHAPNEDDCNRLVAEAWKVMAAVVPVHRRLMYDPVTHHGQIEVMTTPFYHPILPLIYDSDLARPAQPQEPLPPRFHFPEDAAAQTAKAFAFYRATFGRAPLGVWPGEGAVAQPVMSLLAQAGALWAATDQQVLARSAPGGLGPLAMYQVGEPPVALVFRDTRLSDRIGFDYQNVPPAEAAEDFVRGAMALAPETPGEERILTVILDGENAWEWYRQDEDGKQFLRALYRRLTELQQAGLLITVTPAEFIAGNPDRDVPAHPVAELPRIDQLWPGSWIGASFATWIGEPEENRAWEHLLRTRLDLAGWGLAAPDPALPPPARSDPQYAAWMAWESMYAAEGSDWFWWFGSDQNAYGGEAAFEHGFLTLLRSVYRFAAQALGRPLAAPEFAPVLGATEAAPAAGGAMSRGEPAAP